MTDDVHSLGSVGPASESIHRYTFLNHVCKLLWVKASAKCSTYITWKNNVSSVFSSLAALEMSKMKISQH